MIKLLIHVAKWTGAAALTVLLAWQASSGAVREESEVIVHVGVPDVEIRIDEFRFTVDRPWDCPVSCELPPGDHLLTMHQAGVELYREVFTLENGRGRVLTAWDEDGRLSGAPELSSPASPEPVKELEIVVGPDVDSRTPAGESRKKIGAF
ncbi:MAG: hypothetical protein P4L85_06485 [Paludisphaera borealis]|uniref:hypothetical protein n=1 Tax=Paludisphaera borealis TaxID=1387353 RepID=UPI00283D7FDF|nr:hypothetical protein [Paludisphaera borealis]MDR3618981.1 hypothetical protein [Paludisphaera borealis]